MATTCAPVTSIDEAVKRMHEIDAWFPPHDGISAFNRMYLAVTPAVASNLTMGFFKNPGFLDQLDIRFANYYFGALDNALNGRPIPRCWNALWKRRLSTGVLPLQFAIAGMNAHINHDLVLALIDTFEGHFSSKSTKQRAESRRTLRTGVSRPTAPRLGTTPIRSGASATIQSPVHGMRHSSIREFPPRPAAS